MAESKLSEENIYECLKSFNVPVRLNDIKVPSREFIIRVFECFLRDLQLDITNPILRPWQATNHIEEPEVYEDTQLLILLAMSVNHITNPCGLQITIKDIIDPKPKRTKKILNYLIVFWNYYLQKYAHFHTAEESLESEKKKAEDLILENESLDEKYSDMIKALKTRQPKEELASIHKSKEDKAEKLKAECEKLGSDYQDLKAKEINIRNQISATDVQIVTAKGILDELSQRILSSPERINREIKNLDDKIKAEDSKIREWESKYKENVKKTELQYECLKEEEKVLNTLNETNESINDLRETVKSTVDINQKIDEETEKVNRLEMDLERKEDEKLQQKQKSIKVFLNSKKQLERLNEMVKTYQSDEVKVTKEVEFLKIGTTTLQEDIDAESNKILHVIEKCKEAEARTKERETQYKARLIEIDTQFKSDCDEVADMIRKSFAIGP